MTVAYFERHAPGIMRKLMADFDLSAEDAAAIMGNAGHESVGLTVMQELKPTVPGSRGGWGWMQWTGPRRRDFEAYCDRNDLDRSSHQANYGFLYCELKGLIGTEKAALYRLKAVSGLEQKVRTFSDVFLRPGVRHYDSRIKWARIALDAFEAEEPGEAPPPHLPTPVVLRPQAAEPTRRVEAVGWIAAAAALVTWLFLSGD